MNITFVVGGYSPVVVGGVKVVYEYANHLQDRGHQVTIVHPYRCEPRLLLRQRVKALAWKARTKVIDRPLVPWFTLRPDVQVLLTRTYVLTLSLTVMQSLQQVGRRQNGWSVTRNAKAASFT